MTAYWMAPMFLVRALLFLALSCVGVAAQTNPGFVSGKPICANYPSNACPAPANPYSLNQAFQNKQDYPIPASAVPTWPGVQYANLFPGASVGAQIDAACAALGGQNGLVVIPSTMGTGQSVAGILDNCRIMDLRGTGGFNQFGDNAGFLKDIMFVSRFTAAASSGNLQAVEVYAEPWSGGTNVTGTKSNYTGLFSVMAARTPGQKTGLGSIVSNFSNGDTIAFGGYAMSWGRNNAGGDEGTEGLSIGSYQGNTVMTGTVTGVVGSLVSYGSAVNSNVLGELRPLINTNAAKVYSTGTVSGVTGAPPIVTGSGTTWTSLGSGAVSNLFMEIDGQTSGGLMLVVPVRSITDDTHLVLDYVSEGVDATLPSAGASGTYKIFKGGNVTAVTYPTGSATGSVTVTPASDFANGDTVQQPLGYAHTNTGVHLVLADYLPTGTNSGSAGLQIANIGTQTVRNGISQVGAFDRGIELNGVVTWGLIIDNDIGGGLVQSFSSTPNANTRMLGVNHSSGVGGTEYFAYDRATDNWWTTQPIRVPVTTVAGLASFPCTGSSQGARMAVSNANSPTFLGALTTGSPGTFTPVICNGSVWVAG